MHARFPETRQSVILTLGALALVLAIRTPAHAQELKALQTPKDPLVLKAQGSFYMGGETVKQTRGELGNFGPAGQITFNQMYVRYMIPQNGGNKLPVVMIHGSTLTGKCWETTPDGRMGWDEYFVRKGHAAYVPDQVARGRSGFNQAVFNNVRDGGAQPNTLPRMWRFSDENNWTNFRFGPKDGESYKDAQFPVEALPELSKQAVPDMSAILPRSNPNNKALSDLATQLKGAVLMGHSQSGSFPLEAALIDSANVKGAVLIEPGGIRPNYTDKDIATLAKLPILVVFGDHLDDSPVEVTGHFWKRSFDGCNAFIKRVNVAGGNAEMLHLPDRGIRGNSHMLMQDKNDSEVADLILKWIDGKVGK
jgi:pimeloyl-ACP methyl ester carboxylesterase